MRVINLLQSWFPILLLIAAVAIGLLLLANSYTVVPPDEAHVLVSRSKGRKVYCTRAGIEYAGSAYWKVPFIQQRAIIPLENIQLAIDDIPLRDKAMAKFLADVVAWLNIDNPLLAAERVGKIKGVESVISEVKNVIQAVTRNQSMYWTVVDIMQNRKDFSQAVEKSVNEELKEWGMRLVELEVIHFDDIEGYTVVKDLEERQSTVINAETRKLVAGQNKEANIVESNALKETELIKAQNEEAYRKRQLERDEAIGIRDQEKEMNVAEQEQKANEKRIEAARATAVGKANYEKEATITYAEADAAATVKKGEATAEVVRKTGTAEADVVRLKGFAEADATDKRADALKKYNEAGISLEIINASKTVQIAQATAWQEAMKAAKIQVYSGGEGSSLFGMSLSPKGGFSLGAFAEIAKEHGIDVQKAVESLAKGTLPVVDIGKAVSPEKKPQEESKENVKN